MISHPSRGDFGEGVVEAWICRTCGVQQAPSAAPPRECPICSDERQWVPASGQQWTTLTELRAEGRSGELRPLEPSLDAVEIRPPVGIGQRALLLTTPNGRVLWDCVGYLDDDLIGQVRAGGGLDAIAVSHPHFYGTMTEWASAFGATVWIAEADRRWVQRPDPSIRWWSDEVEILPGVRVLQCGGHFEGSAVLHWAGGAGGRGALMVGDTATVVPDRRHVSFMRSYPNLVPLPPATVAAIVERLTRYPFERIYGAWTDREILDDGAEALQRSLARYTGALSS